MPVRADADASFKRSIFGGRRMADRLNGYDLAAALLFALLLVLVACTFRDYAIFNDEEVQQRYGEMIIAYYASGFVDQALFHFRNLYLYGGLFDILAVGMEKLLSLDPYAVRHLLTALTASAGSALYGRRRALSAARAPGCWRLRRFRRAASGTARCSIIRRTSHLPPP